MTGNSNAAANTYRSLDIVVASGYKMSFTARSGPEKIRACQRAVDGLMFAETVSNFAASRSSYLVDLPSVLMLEKIPGVRLRRQAARHFDRAIPAAGRARDHCVGYICSHQAYPVTFGISQ